ncbi:restriction endonuclease subunit S [Faecalibacterium sp. An122]|uniref:restriction endonuclease subunit S n=1 Tax=Faecalibacterium sp. An122 TaxID=1965551 RepID=UPI001FA8BF6B|nr:restriction endonuclease subunit S [Faecalibacterium sp. An122]
MANVSSSNGLEKRPKLRFPGFDEPWHGKPFGDLIQEYSDRTQTEDEDTLLSAAIEGMFLNSELFGHQRGASNKGYKKIKYGTMVLSTQNLHLGNANVNLRFKNGMVSPAYKTYDITGCSIELLAHWIKSDAAKHFFYNATTVGASMCRRNVEWKTLYEQPLFLPSTDEQDKIASFLSFLTQRIDAQQKYVATLKKYKRGAVRCLLSAKSCPLRNARWTTAKMGELGSFVKGAPLSKADISEDGTPFILYGELYTTYNEVVTSVKRRTQAQVDETFLSRVGDVVIPTSGETPEEISTASCVMLPNVILAGDLYIFRGDKVDGRIMSYLLNHVVNAKIARIAQGKSVVHIQASELCKLTLTYPDKSTQNTIIGFLSSLDDRIMNEENALAFLSDLKEGLLQQLFI